MIAIIAVSGIEELLFELANALRIPVFAAAIGALAFVLFDLGAFFVELSRRRRQGRREHVQEAATSARQALAVHDKTAAQQALMPLASSAQMADTLARRSSTATTSRASTTAAPRRWRTSTSARCASSSAAACSCASARRSGSWAR